MKQNFKIAEKKEIMKLNERITYLSNEIEIKQSKIDFIDKRHKNLQLKYLKLLGDKRKIAQDNIPIFKYNKDLEKDKLSEINNTTRSKYLESVKSYNSIIKKTDFNTKNTKISKNENTNNNNSKNIKVKKDIKDIHLPEILQNKKNKNKRALSLQKEEKKDKSNKNIRNNALKDLNMLLSEHSDEGGENINKNEEIEDEEDDNDNEENEES